MNVSKLYNNQKMKIVKQKSYAYFVGHYSVSEQNIPSKQLKFQRAESHLMLFVVYGYPVWC